LELAAGQADEQPAFCLAQSVARFKSGELSVLLLAMSVAVLSLTAVGFFTSRISQGVRAQAAEVLAADLRWNRRIPSPRSTSPKRRGAVSRPRSWWSFRRPSSMVT
jgi:predicted lysophospholipase L1 biosynthesis ABC-type transport system permease subunit